jgi:putative peptide zinc metalloprotease protein
LLQAHERMEVLNEAAGFVDKIIATPGAQVKKNQPLVQIRNSELELELATTRAKYDEVLARLRQAMQEATPNLKPLNRLLESTTNQLRKLESDQRSLIVRARQDGIWVSPHVDEFIGRWLQRGSPLGLLINSNAFEFRATVKQEDADALFGRKVPSAEIRLYGQADKGIAIEKWKVIPGEQQNLPSPALGWHGGGEMAVSPQDPQGRRVTEPFFEVVAEIAPSDTGRDGALRRPGEGSEQAAHNRTAQRTVPTTTAALLLDGRSGKIRFALEPEALLPRWIRRLEQMFQKRYQL